MKDHRINLITALLERQIECPAEPGTCREDVKEAVRLLTLSLLCDLKYDTALLNEVLMSYGWTPEDVEYFGISDLFSDTEKEE